MKCEIIRNKKNKNLDENKYFYEKKYKLIFLFNLKIFL